MKLLLCLSVMFMIGSAEASYYQKNCTNAEATARWASGHREYGAFFRDTDERGQWFLKEFDADELNISIRNIKRLGRKDEGGEGWSSSQTWYSGTATVTPKPEAAEEFKKLYPTGEFIESVICTEIFGG